MAISTQSCSAHVEERDRERIPKRKAADNIDLNKMSHRMSAASYKMTEMIPSTSAHLIDRSEDVIFELV